MVTLNITVPDDVQGWVRQLDEVAARCDRRGLDRNVRSMLSIKQDDLQITWDAVAMEHGR
jgi:hypothetical protein